jgi:hypothetical protein
VWGSEFTVKAKATALQGGSSRNRCYAERKIVGSGDCVVVVVASYGFLAQSPFRIYLNLREYFYIYV